MEPPRTTATKKILNSTKSKLWLCWKPQQTMFLSLTEAYYVEHKHGAILTFIAFIILAWKILISIFIYIFRHNVRHATLYMLVLYRISSRYQGQGLIFPYCEAYNICTWKDIFLPHINLVILTTIHAHSLVQISGWYHQIKSLLLPPA